MKTTCTYCGCGEVYFGALCREYRQANLASTQALDRFWSHSRASLAHSEHVPFFRPGWAIPFKLLWLPARVVWWLMKVPF